MTALGLCHRPALHMAKCVTKTALVGLMAAVITSVCTAAPARAATGTLNVIFQGSGGPNPYIPSNAGGKTLAWNGDATCRTIALPGDANGFSATNHTNQPIAVYGGSNRQGTLLNYIGVGRQAWAVSTAPSAFNRTADPGPSLAIPSKCLMSNRGIYRPIGLAF